MARLRGTSSFAPLALAAGTACACRTPTQVTVEISTDVPCDSVQGASLQVGSLESIESSSPSAEARQCSADGRIGSIVLVPRGSKDEPFAFKVAMGVGVGPDRCAVESGKCVVARRALRFIPHTELSLPVVLRQACMGVSCPATETCVRGRCVPASIDDPERCAGSACSEEALWPGVGTADAGPDTSPPVDATPVTDAPADQADAGPVVGSWKVGSMSESAEGFVLKTEGVTFAGGKAELARAWTPGPNLLVNPGAETGNTTGWVDVEHLTIDSGRKRSGSYSFGHYDGVGDIEGRQHVSLSAYAPFIAVGRAKVAFGAWVQKAAGDSAHVIFELLDAATQPGGTPLWRRDPGGPPAEDQWTSFPADVLSPASAAKAGVYLSGHYNTGSTCNAWFDDLVIQVATDRYAASGIALFQKIAPQGVAWGKLDYEASTPAGTSVTVSVRTAKTGAGDWRRWSVATGGQDIGDLAGVADGDRGIQVKIELASDGMQTPTVSWFSVDGVVAVVGD
jgi:hypothetical protein